MNTLTPNEITLAFNRICENHPCEKCPIKNYRISSCQDNFSSCYVIFSHAVLTGKLDLDCKPVAVFETETTTPPTCSKTEQVPDATALLKWCKVGQWMFDNDGALCEIIEVQPHQILVRYPGTKLELRIFIFTNLRPVRFRPYTFEEACAILGKQIRYIIKADEYNIEDSVCASLITEIGKVKDGDEAIIDGMSSRDWQDWDATIDGVPFGVPEVDTDAEKEAQQ